ncbi:MAG: nascent polypeptide-associated complex protein [Candidatus Micrarchaeota archaeon]|nr:nascent polypeptide-associated complex protein [Candidatus Micrarchaeota archaeon]
MLPNMDPKNIAKLMKQMGIKTDELAASKVTIELSDGGRITIFEPSVLQIQMHGQTSFQISGKIHQEKEPGEEDIRLVMEAAGCSREEAQNALRETEGDIAEAILLLKEE